MIKLPTHLMQSMMVLAVTSDVGGCECWTGKAQLQAMLKQIAWCLWVPNRVAQTQKNKPSFSYLFHGVENVNARCAKILESVGFLERNR
ncbi:hypothetical protein DEO72_LG5g826 [Vigna unguiculata]|uniref:Secreted protein n=1 Tax=Vigna unguiculata TaxID=3917 RepID=A0A4D6LVQ7_VIGUN|nr:hypothetical protein DEO72_LG5g826 [Vigna unguiculata]